MRKLKLFSRVPILAFLLVFLTTVFGVGNAWGTVVSGTTYTTNTSSFPTGWTKSQGSGSTTSYIALYSGNYIQTDDFCQNGITSIVVKGRKVGGPSETERILTV